MPVSDLTVTPPSHSEMAVDLAEPQIFPRRFHVHEHVTNPDDAFYDSARHPSLSLSLSLFCDATRSFLKDGNRSCFRVKFGGILWTKSESAVVSGCRSHAVMLAVLQYIWL